MVPKSNGVVEIISSTEREESGFCCMTLIAFLTRNGVKDWDEWHGAHVKAEQKRCPFRNDCKQYKMIKNRPAIQLELKF